MSEPTNAGRLPVPGSAQDVAAFIQALRAVKVWAGDPSLETLRRRTGVATSTLSDAFNPRRTGLPAWSLVQQILRACGAHPSQIAEWELAWGRLRLGTGPATVAESTVQQHSEPGPGRRSEAGGQIKAPVSADPGRWVPRQLPADVSGFIGRADAVVALADRPVRAPATVITGTAGVGKSALAIHWAHRIAADYPDGQLYLDLHGQAGAPVITATTALSLLLQSLGVPGERIPVDLHLLVGLYRSVLADRRVLVVLDNVVDTAHVRSLLPGGPHCHALITSRDALTGLLVRDGAARIILGTLRPSESAELLATHLGLARVAAEPQATAELAELCAHLPLALRICAANLANRPHQTIAGAVRELSGTDRLGRLQVAGDPESAVSSAFDVSRESLSEPARHLFQLLGLVPGPEIDSAAAAALIGRNPGDPVRELDELLDAHLVFEPNPGRFRMHDLLALYARRRAAAAPTNERHEALHRLLSWYMLSTDAAAQLVTSGHTLEDRAELRLTGTAREFRGPEDAAAWFRAELPNLTTAVNHVADHGPAPFAWHLVNGLNNYLYSRTLGVQHLALARTALRAAQAHGDVMGQGMSHTSLEVAAVSRGDLTAALQACEAAKECFSTVQHTTGVKLAVGDLGDISLRLGDLSRAARYFGESVGRQPRMTRMDCFAVTNLALVHRIRGEHAEALRCDSECLAYGEQNSDTRVTSMAKGGLGMTYLDLGDPVTAEPLLLEAYSNALEFGVEGDAVDTLAGLVLVCLRTGRVSDALTWMTPLRDLVDRGVSSGSGDDRAQAAILEAHLVTGRLDEALTIGEQALQEYDRAGHRLTAMRVRIMVGRVLAAQGKTAAARAQWESALRYATEQRLPTRTVVEGLLAELP